MSPSRISSNDLRKGWKEHLGDPKKETINSSPKSETKRHFGFQKKKNYFFDGFHKNAKNIKNQLKIKTLEKLKIGKN